MVVICAFADIYGCRISDLSARLVERYEETRDLLVRQSRCLTADDHARVMADAA